MIKRVYVDNYKCMVNFEISLGDISLLLGQNGSGKSSVFQVLQMLVDFVPKRNIETWIHYLQGMPVNEVDACPRLTGRESDCKRVVEALADSRRNPLPGDAPPSLRIACDELARVP